jgi:2-succinyl-5-enolpyruvyl-6-hydroxy-3-cyclohexene-1-carboxylate synthase
MEVLQTLITSIFKKMLISLYMSDIQSELRRLVSSYGYQKVNESLQSMMKDEYIYFLKLFQNAPVVHQIPESSLQVQPLPIIKKEKKSKMVKKVNLVNTTVSQEPVDTMIISNEIKEVIVTDVTKTSNPLFRDPKEMKEFQKTAEDLKKKENDEKGIELSQILTKENLKQWIENEGHTYAWVAREKAGCKESQIAATAQMMGIKSKISKKKALIMSKS